MRRRLLALAGAALLAVPAVAGAQAWARWTSHIGPFRTAPDTVKGTMQIGSQTVNATWIGRSPSFVNLNNTGTNYWALGTAFSTGSVTGPATSDIIALASFTSNYLLFDTPVLNLYMALNSLGRPGLGVTYTFDQNFSILKDNSSGTCPYWGCGSLSGSGTNTLVGVEGSGLIQFAGATTSLSWTSTAEGWNGFTVGADGIGTTVPEPGTWLLMATGLVGIGGVARRRRK